MTTTSRRGRIVKREGKRRTSWAFVIDADGEDGRRKQVWRGGFAREKDAIAALRAYTGATDRGEVIEPVVMTVSEYLDKWAAGLASPDRDLRPSTIESYRQIVEVHAKPRLGQIQLQRLTGPRFREFLADIAATGKRRTVRGKVVEAPLAPRTVRYAATVLGIAFADAVEDGLLVRNPAERSKRRKKETRAAKPSDRLRYWSPAELRTFLHEAKDEPLFPALTLAAFTGVRRGELLGLRYQDIDLNAGTVTVSRPLILVSNRLRFSRPKSGEQRTIRIGPAMVEILRQHVAAERERRMLLGLGRPQPGDLLFVYADAGSHAQTADPDVPPDALHPKVLTDALKRVAKRAGLPAIPFHGLRHSHATKLLAEGTNPKTVQARLGHSSIAITLGIYSHALHELDERAAVEAESGLL
jgi:integrase